MCQAEHEEFHLNSTDVKSQFYFSTITESRILKNLRNLKVSIATGVDGILAKMLKLSCDIIASSLTYIFNLSISKGAFVNDWKTARLVPVRKSEVRKKYENYRPISIRPIVRKLFEKVVFGQFYQHRIDNSLLFRF